MNVSVNWVPVENWPGVPRNQSERIRAQFSAPWQTTLDLLDKELWALSARNTVIQAYWRREDLRLDGQPRAGCVPTSPGVIVTFTTKAGELSFPCDTFDRWNDNLRAIALALEALRRVERYGVTRQSEQYKGWAKLPPAPEPGRMKPEDAKVFLALHSEGIPIDAENFRTAYRAAARRLHTDNQDTGNPHLFSLLAEAKQALIDAYGWTA
jgi:hypothetical protein